MNGKGGSVVGWLPSTLEAMHPPPALRKQMRKNLFKTKKNTQPPLMKTKAKSRTTTTKQNKNSIPQVSVYISITQGSFLSSPSRADFTGLAGAHEFASTEVADPWITSLTGR